MPVAPIFQPEVAARGIRQLAEHPNRRNIWVGVSTAMTILGEWVAPWLLDIYLGRKGISGQQTARELPRWGQPARTPETRPSNGRALGPFDFKAHNHDPVLRTTLNPSLPSKG